MLLAPQIVVHRDPRFWTDPERFDPGRFVGDETKRPKFAYFPFGGGSRQCIGEGLAWMEGVFVLATILRDWQLLPEARRATGAAGHPLGQPASEERRPAHADQTLGSVYIEFKIPAGDGQKRGLALCRADWFRCHGGRTLRTHGGGLLRCGLGLL